MSLLTRLRDLSEKATKGPWEHHGRLIFGRGGPAGQVMVCQSPFVFNQDVDFQLIVLMQNNLNKLLDVVDAAKEYNKHIQISAGNQFGKHNFNTIVSELNAALAELERET